MATIKPIRPLRYTCKTSEIQSCVCPPYDIISDSEMQKAWKKIAEHYKPPFMEIDVVGGTIGDGVAVDGR